MNGMEHEIREFVARVSGVDPLELTAETSLWPDLELYGDDLEDVLVEFGQRFKVDLGGLNLSEHAPPEFEWSYWFRIDWPKALYKRFPNLKPKWHSKYVPITIADLVRAAEVNRWRS